jgi:glycosyltransferase involved in cell wall biosynthesis
VRIAIVGTELCAVDRRGGGLEQVLRRWAAWLADHHDVVMVSPGGPVIAEEPFATISVAGRAGLPAALASFRPDLVSLHNRPQWFSLCPPAAAVAVTFHNYPPAWRLAARAADRIRRRPPRWRLSAVSAALAGAAATHLGYEAGSVGVTPPSIDPAFLDGPRRRPGNVVLSPNRLLRKKGVEDLLGVAGRPEFAEVMFSFADVISPWARPTAEHRSLRSAIHAVPNACLFPPAASPAELAERYATSGVVACPVREPEGLGLVALEAQACRAPLVSVDLGGLAEATFPPNRCVPPGDPDALAGALCDALRLPAQDGPRRAVLRRHSPAAAGAAFEAWLTTA